jgi:hypothetical protein
MRQALVRNARMDRIIALHDPARRDRAAAFYASLMKREPYFTDAAFRQGMRERWPIVDHERLADPRLASVVAGPLVSVVVPTFARRALVAEAVGSALAQDWPNLEVIVVCDHDPEAAAIAEALGGDPRVRVVDLDRNHGAGGAVPRDAGITLARGDLAYLDDDNWWAPDHVSSVVCALLRAGVVRVFVDERRRRDSFSRPERQGIDTRTIVHRRALIARHGGWIDRRHDYAHDWELVSRWVAAGEPWACTGTATVNYGTSENAQSDFMAALADRRARAHETKSARAPRRGRSDDPSRGRGTLDGTTRSARPSRAARRAGGRRDRRAVRCARCRRPSAVPLARGMVARCCGVARRRAGRVAFGATGRAVARDRVVPAARLRFAVDATC